MYLLPYRFTEETVHVMLTPPQVTSDSLQGDNYFGPAIGNVMVYSSRLGCEPLRVCLCFYPETLQQKHWPDNDHKVRPVWQFLKVPLLSIFLCSSCFSDEVVDETLKANICHPVNTETTH